MRCKHENELVFHDKGILFSWNDQENQVSYQKKITVPTENLKHETNEMKFEKKILKLNQG